MRGPTGRRPGRPDSGRTELALRLFEQGLSHAAIAELLGILEASSRQACYRRRRKLEEYRRLHPLPRRPAIQGAI